jgi:hypothetical protein
MRWRAIVNPSKGVHRTQGNDGYLELYNTPDNPRHQIGVISVKVIRIANRGYVIVHGKIAFEGRSTDELNNNDLIKKFYLGL